jgi:hypothetical protein
LNLAATIEISAGGPGSGCTGPNCGRPKSMGNITKGKVKGLGTLPEDPDVMGDRRADSFWVDPDGEVYRESDILGPGFHEHWEHARELMKRDPKKFAWIKKEWNALFPKGKELGVKDWFGGKYKFVNALIDKGAIRAYATSGGHANWDSGIQVGKLSRQVVSRVEALVDQMAGDKFRVDYINSEGDTDSVEGTSKEVMRDLRKALAE